MKTHVFVAAATKFTQGRSVGMCVLQGRTTNNLAHKNRPRRAQEQESHKGAVSSRSGPGFTTCQKQHILTK